MFPNPLFQLGKFARQLPVGGGQLPHLHEGAHDGDIHLHGPFAVEDAGKHGDALFGEDIGQIFSMGPSPGF